MPSIYFLVAIFLFRFLDVTIETVRLLFVVNNRSMLAAVIAFFEVTTFTWVFASGVLTHQHWSVYVAWGAGFAAGQYLGGTFGHKLNGKLDKRGTR